MESFNLLGYLKSFFQDGGLFMFVILFIWVTGVGISIFKYLMLKIYSTNPHKFFNAIKGFVLQNDIKQAINACSNSGAILPKVVKSGLKRANQDRESIEDAVSSSLLEHTPKITYQLSYISLCANISTLFGLLGTIQGLIMSFASVAGADPSEKARLLADGIAKAMNTTALGLVSAITIMVLHTYLVGKSQKLSDSVDEIATKMIDLLTLKKKNS